MTGTWIPPGDHPRPVPPAAGLGGRTGSIIIHWQWHCSETAWQYRSLTLTCTASLGLARLGDGASHGHWQRRGRDSDSDRDSATADSEIHWSLARTDSDHVTVNIESCHVTVVVTDS